MKKILSILLVGVLLIGGFGTVVATQRTQKENVLQEKITFSEPILSTHDGSTTVKIKETTSSSTEPGDPVLPYFTKVVTFPLGTTITDVTCDASSTEIRYVAQDVAWAPGPTPTDASPMKGSVPTKQNQDVYSSDQLYPTARVNYQVGGGLDGNNHVTILSISYYPLQYSPRQHLLYFTPSVQMTVTYEPPKVQRTFANGTNLLVIAPSEFSNALQPLINHKNQHGIATILQTTEDIVATYQGRDPAEKIKYAIKDAVETKGVTYVLLVGGVDKLPIRESAVGFHGLDNEKVITDLYYADLYDAHGNFCSWDANNNSIFGEPGDRVDLYPDVNLGRLACASVAEVNVVVDKIIHYETGTYGSDWYNNMIFIGGNTFPWFPGNEGETLNTLVMGIMSRFTPEVIWTSKHNFNRYTISSSITKGAGFLDYSGHGFEFGMATYTPSGLQKKFYYTRYVKDLKNGYKLPVMFFDACLTAKLDYVVQDFLNYRPYNLLTPLAKALKVNTSMRLTCYAWTFMALQGGGAIATLGATRTAFGGVDDGAGKISLEFFSAYNSSQYLGQMTSKMQTGYINDVHGDAFTVEEFILLGDPTLRLGGYPSG
jgi:hypothetical protein